MSLNHTEARIVSFKALFFFDKLANLRHHGAPAQRLNLGPYRVLHPFSQASEVDIRSNGSPTSVDLQDLQTGLLIRQRQLQDQVEPPRAQKRRVNYVEPIGGA